MHTLWSLHSGKTGITDKLRKVRSGNFDSNPRNFRLKAVRFSVSCLSVSAPRSGGGGGGANVETSHSLLPFRLLLLRGGGDLHDTRTPRYSPYMLRLYDRRTTPNVHPSQTPQESAALLSPAGPRPCAAHRTCPVRILTTPTPAKMAGGSHQGRAPLEPAPVYPPLPAQ